MCQSCWLCTVLPGCLVCLQIQFEILSLSPYLVDKFTKLSGSQYAHVHWGWLLWMALLFTEKSPDSGSLSFLICKMGLRVQIPESLWGLHEITYVRMPHKLYKYWLLFYLLFLPRTQTGIWTIQLPANCGMNRWVRDPGKNCSLMVFLPLAPINKHLPKGCRHWSGRHLIYRNMNFFKDQD